MKKLFLATTAIVSLAAGAASAADMAVKARPMPPPPIFSWTGCFFGGNIGGVWVDKDYALRSVGNGIGGIALANPVGFGSHSASSYIGGLQAGCDYQFAGGFVIGIQGDYDWSNANASHVDPFGGLTTLHSNTKSLASVTGRFGYAWDRFLGYVRAGGAWERDDYTWFVTNAPGVSTAASGTRSGWTIGIGGEYAFTNFVSAFVEYDYYDFGTRSVGFPVGPVAFNFDVKETKSVIKGGLNFRFGGAGPVVAKY